MSIETQPFFLRMKDELSELREKKLKLAEFIEGSAFDALSFEMREAMNAQLGGMVAYEFALNARLVMLVINQGEHKH